MKNKINTYIYNKLSNFCEWLQRKLYDDCTYNELESKCYRLEDELEELKYELEYHKELNAYRAM